MAVDVDKFPLDPEILTYLDRCEALYPSDTGTLDADANRSLYNKMCEAFATPIPEGVRFSDRELSGRHGTIPVREYRPADLKTDLMVIYYHGGGFVVGNLETHHSLCAEIAQTTGCRLVAVDYRLAPEFRHPVSFEDALDAFLALDDGRTMVAGDSAGATLAAAVCIAQRATDQVPVGQLLIYPWLGGELYNLASYTRNRDAPGLTIDDLADYSALRTGTEPPLDDPTYYPLAATEFSGLPPCIALAAEFDPLCDDAGFYVEQLRSAGVSATCHLDKGLIHGHLRARHMSAKVARSFDRICSGIVELDRL